MLRLAFDFIITWRETRTRPNAYKYIVRQRAVAPILAQCPAADFQHTRHLTVAQVHVFFWRNRAISENAVNHRRQPVDTLVDGLHPRIVFRFQFIKHYID